MMKMFPARRMPLIVVASARAGVAERVVQRLRSQGAIAYSAHSAHGCLRVATSVRPDAVLIDPPLLDRRLERLLRAHPTSADARLMPLTGAALAETGRGAELAAA